MRVILWIFALIGFATVAGIVLLIGAVVHYKPAPVQVAAATILTVDLTGTVSEKSSGGFLEQLTASNRLVRLPDLLTALRRGAEDGRVKGLVVRTGPPVLGLAQTEEVLDAIAAFRAKGKFAYAYADSFGDIENGTRPYYLASGFDQIWLQPTGAVALDGFGAQIELFKGTLDKLGVTAEIERRKEFKTGGIQFTDAKLPDSDRAGLTDLVVSLSDQVVASIAAGRKLAPAEVRTLIDGAPYSATDALAKHLIDHIGYRDEMEDAARTKAGAGAKMMAPASYLSAAQASPDTAGADGLAIIRAVGEIKADDPDASPLGGTGDAIGADTMVKAFKQAVDNVHVKAIVFRIDSPGGSETASESIWRAVSQAQAHGKPVVVSMSDVAGSGGYYIAAPASKIVAEPLTQTGSIGVYGGKISVGGLADKLGVTHDDISIGKNALVASSFTTFTPDQRQHFAAMIDDAYQTFLARVASGRHMDVASVEPIARGRVWSGVEAKERGLVDELGGIDVAIRLAKEAAKLPLDQAVPTWEYPEAPSPLEALRRGMGLGEQAMAAARMLDRMGALVPFVEQFEDAQADGTRGAWMAPVEAGAMK